MAHSFIMRRRNRAGSMRSTGAEIYSYAECIARWEGLETVSLRTERFSSTTSRHQTALRETLMREQWRPEMQDADPNWQRWHRH